jgi:hypothetical protein
MHIIKIGSNSEFIKLEIPTSLSSEGWIEVSVEIRTNNFKGNINPSIETYDILNFLSALEKLYKSLKGSASFESREEQIAFKLEAQSGGHIEVTGVAWSEACYGGRLEFCFLLDQTFLQEPLNNLRFLASELQSNA